MQFLRGGAHFRQRMSNYYSFPENEPHPWKPGKTRVVFFFIAHTFFHGPLISHLSELSVIARSSDGEKNTGV